MRNLGLATIFAASAALAFACGDDPSTSSSDNTTGSGNSMNTGGDATGGNGTGNTGNTGAGASGATGGTGGTGGNGTGGGTGGGGIDPLCEQCAQAACPNEYATCQSTAGCEEILECVINSGCMGDDFACLFAACGATANMHGGIQGPAAQAAIALGQCLADDSMDPNGQGCVNPGGPCNP